MLSSVPIVFLCGYEPRGVVLHIVAFCVFFSWLLINSLKPSSHLFEGMPALLFASKDELRPGFHSAAFPINLSCLFAVLVAGRHFTLHCALIQFVPLSVRICSSAFLVLLL